MSANNKVGGMMMVCGFRCLICAGLLAGVGVTCEAATEQRARFTSATLAETTATKSVLDVVETVDVGPVWAGHPVRFDLLTHGDLQFIGFYDADRQMTIGKRRVDSREWELVRLPEKIGWDSHNYITMVLDKENHLHVSGNMHGVPLVYFRASAPLDVASLERADMVGERENRTTYPDFIEGPSGKLIFGYRDGGSGNGDQLYNVYDVSTRTWKRLQTEPLTSGEGKMNAYFHGPVKGPDGYFHMCWVWRDTPDCATNHDLSYARSRDLVNWETSKGEALTLPITLESAEVVDPVPAGDGMINGNTVIGFDGQDRTVISYHKYDADGNTQIYNARLEDGGWAITQISDWDYRWEFSGGGTIGFKVGVSPVKPYGEGKVLQRATYPKEGATGWILNENTFEPVAKAPALPVIEPARWRKVESDFPGMGVRWGVDSGVSSEEGTEYRLRWETLGGNRDKKREGPLPEPSMLRVVKLKEATSGN